MPGHRIHSWPSCVLPGLLPTRVLGYYATSRGHAEYIALHESSHEPIFLRQLHDSIDFPCRGSTPKYCDNDAASSLAEDHVFHSQVKHMWVKFHAIRDIGLGGVRVFRVHSADNITKPLGRSDFLRLRGYLGPRDITARSV